MSALDAYLPEAVDQFCIDDALRRLIKTRVSAGYTEKEAEAFVYGVARQLAEGWGLVPPQRPITDSCRESC